MSVSRNNPRSAKRATHRKRAARTPHDGLFHFTFGNVEHARPTIAAMLPAKVAALIDFPSLSVESGHFVDPELAQSETDLLFSALCTLLARYTDLVDEVFRAPNGARAIVAVMRCIRGVTHESAQEVQMAMQRSDLIDEKTYWDIRDPGRREREEGLATGREEASRSILLRQLEARFGHVPVWAAKRVHEASVRKIEQMALDILRAQAITDVVGPETKSVAKTRTRK